MFILVRKQYRAWRSHRELMSRTRWLMSTSVVLFALATFYMGHSLVDLFEGFIPRSPMLLKPTQWRIFLALGR
jgi:Mn2+/Fe2+ NRAMP family transporter